MNPPKPRVRLFLSVDLSGSTAYKDQNDDPLDWVPVFSSFYSDFLSLFRARYAEYCSQNGPYLQALSDRLPNVWKTIGDEIVFVNPVESCLQLAAYLHSFRSALAKYSADLKASPKKKQLDVKGNAWIASFPYPNQTIVMTGDADLITEEIEQSADAQPSGFEFLGPGIDAGFRISKNSKISFMTISPALAYLVCRISRNPDIGGGKVEPLPLYYLGSDSLKGVVKNDSYPIIGIDTERDEKRKQLAQRLNDLTGNGPADAEQLHLYLESFFELHQVPVPSLKMQPHDPDNGDPPYYTEKYLPSWKKEFEAGSEGDSAFTESENDEGKGEQLKDKQAELVVEEAISDPKNT